jgi:hypothetical protein
MNFPSSSGRRGEIPLLLDEIDQVISEDERRSIL